MAVFGIDLGTTYSCIARNDGAGSVAPVELLNAGGKKFIPSVVTYDRKTGQPKVGKIGKACMISHPECTKAFVKREMGKEFCDTPISVAGVERKLSPVEASACILHYLFTEANKIEKGAGREPIRQAVITVPAKFDEQQRARTKLAAEMAGIELLGLLQEPTAAAIAYDIPVGSTVLVFDLGGGTLDVSIVKNDKGNCKAIGTPAGDGQLGGMDWDTELVKLCMQKIGKKADPSDKKTWNSLMGKAENIKQALTEEDCIVDDDVESGNISDDEEIEIERSEFEVVCKGLLDRCIDVVDKAIANAKAQDPKLKIDFFLTVGGSSRMPMIRKALARKYGAQYGKGKAEDEWLRINDPDTAIAIGAAKYANMLASGAKTANTAAKNLKAIEDKATHSYGIMIQKGTDKIIKNIIKSSFPILYKGEVKGLKLFRAGQNFHLEIFENDSDSDYAQVEQSKTINSCNIDMGKTMPKGTDVQFDIERDKDGLINIGFKCGSYMTSFEANPADSLIDEETKANIEHSIRMME